MKSLLTKICAALVLGLFATCAFAWQSSPNANVYSQSNSMTMGTVFAGTVVNVRQVRIQASTTANYAGDGAGAAIGGLAASQIGHGNGSIVAGILGTLFGADAGHALSNRVAGYNGLELIIALQNHNMISVTQAGAGYFTPGEPVFVIESNGSVRVVARTASWTERPSQPENAPTSYNNGNM